MRTEPTSRHDLSSSLRESAFRDLCAEYDGLLKPGAEHGPESVRHALTTFARVFDLPIDDEAPAGEIWRRVRPILAVQVAAEGSVEPSGPLAAEGKVFLPADAGAASPEGAFAEAARPLSLLVVEDDPELSGAMVELLTEAGHRVVAATATAEDAAAVAAHHAIDFAIVDVELAGAANGVDLADQLQARWGLQVLFLSGSPNEHLVKLDTALGFVGKPFSAAELLAAVTLAGGFLDRRQPV